MNNLFNDKSNLFTMSNVKNMLQSKPKMLNKNAPLI
jgi:hypothetical protein